MKLFIYTLSILTFPIFLLGCNSSIKAPEDETIPDTLAKTRSGLNFFETPVAIDSSQYIIYPLIKEKAKIEREYGSSSEGSGRSTTYWNLLFYNTLTKQYHLLDTMKMIVSFYDRESDVSNTHPSDGVGIADRFIFYKIICSDYNKDSRLDEDDPKYLYVSDRNGNNFKQITPSGLDITGWHIIKNAGKVFIDAVKDTNNDKKFDSNDEMIPLVYDLVKGGMAEPVFNNEFKIATEKLLKEKWNKQTNAKD